MLSKLKRRLITGLVVLFSLSCSKDVNIENQRLKIPLTLVFSSQEYKDIYYGKIIDRINESNKIYDNVNSEFFVESIVIRDYDKTFVASDEMINHLSSMYNKSIPIFVMDVIYNDENRKFGGFSVTNGNICQKFVMLRGPRMAESPILAHELGHLMGLSHSANYDNVMFPFMNNNNELTRVQKKTVRNKMEKYSRRCLSQ